ncbi:peptide deformylase [Sulfurimonas sp.]|uniref:peptide deformylase n=1 Tax=Sulfurimonas sp. TaxID=2022749 RepID=UPI002618928E|nr:peptide deformylase [Sulfurimonas sp.]
MIRDIIKYPKTPSLEFGANVRHFNQELFDLIQDLKDTIQANTLDALAAFQIGSPLSIIVLKQEDGSYLEIINPRIIKREGTVEPIERTAYFPGLSAKTKRYEKIKLIYEDRNGEQQFLDAGGELSITLQRKLDYVFGSSFIVRLDEEERKVFDAKLENGTDAITNNGCPTVFKRDSILNLIKGIFVISLLALAGAFFLSDANLALLKTAEEYSMITLLLLTTIYFFYAQYEGKLYKNCSSCQVGNIIGVTAITLAKILVLFIANYFILW